MPRATSFKRDTGTPVPEHLHVDLVVGAGEKVSVDEVLNPNGETLYTAGQAA